MLFKDVVIHMMRIAIVTTVAFVIMATMMASVHGNEHSNFETISASVVQWSMFHHDPYHTGFSSYYAENNTGKLRWNFTTGNGIYSSPAIGKDGTIYVGSNDTYLYAITSDGNLKWRFKTGWYVYSSPAIGRDGTVYVGSYDGKIYSITPDGSEKWSYKTGGIIDSSPTIGQDGTIYIGSRDGTLYALTPSGAVKWRCTTGDAIDSSPAIGEDGTVYVGSEDYYLYAINGDGTLKWKFKTNAGVASSPAIGKDGTVYVGSYDGNLYAISPNGSLKWKYSTRDMVDSSPALGPDGTIYIGSWDGALYAIDANGTLKWDYKTGARVRSSPAVSSDGTVFFGSCDNYIYALYPYGTLKWRLETRDKVISSPAIDNNGTVYVGSHDGNLYAIGISPPSPPLKLRAEAGYGTVNLTWSAPISDGGSEITHYAIYRGNMSGKEHFLCKVSSANTSFTDTDVSPGVMYYYYVVAVNEAGESAPSNEVNATPMKNTYPPSAPRYLTAISGDGYVILKWMAPENDGGSNVIVYRVYRETNGSHKLIAEVSSNQTSYNDTNVENGVTYSYYVTAVNSVGESAKSNEVTATPKASTVRNQIYPLSTWTIILLIIVVSAVVGYLIVRKKRK